MDNNEKVVIALYGKTKIKKELMIRVCHMRSITTHAQTVAFVVIVGTQ